MSEHHYIHRTGWLRAAVLGANDGIVSNASLMFGVASAATGTDAVILAGTAGLVAGALSMAAGEYVSVSSQADTEQRDLDTEREALANYPAEELDELSGIYERRGVDPVLAREVARQLTAKDDLKAHARDELGINPNTRARPLQAAAVSMLSFVAGAIWPLLVALTVAEHQLTVAIAVTGLVVLIAIGLLSARAGGASPLRATLRVLFWGTSAMLITGAIGQLFAVPV